MAVVAKLGWKVFAGVTGVVAAKVTTKLLDSTWQSIRGEHPPANLKQKDVAWQEALTWAVASTAGMTVARLLATRTAAVAWERATGSVPPGLEVPPAPASA